MAASPGGVEVGRISVRVVPDTSKLGADLKVALDRIEARTDLKVSTSIDTTKLDAQARAAVDQAQRAAGDINIKTNVDSSQLREATAASQGLSSGLSGIVTAAAILGPALVPLVAVLGGLAAALAAPAALAAGGLTLFGFLTGAAIKQTEAQNKKLVALKTAVDKAKQSLANTQASAATSAANSLTSAQTSAAASLKSAQQALANAHTTASVSAAAARIQAAHASLSARTSAIQSSQSASVAAAQRRVTEATLAYQAALKGMTPAQLKFIQAQDGLKSAFHNLLATVGSSVLGPVTKALQLLTSILPKVKPILVAFADVFDGFLTSAGDATKSKGFSNLIHLIATQGSQAFKTFAGIIANVTLGISRLGLDILPFGNSVLSGLGTAAKGFADFSASAKAKTDVKKFFDFVSKVGPSVGQALGAIAGALGKIVIAAAPIGTVVVVAIGGLATAIDKIQVKTLTALEAALIAMVAVLSAAKIDAVAALFVALDIPIAVAVGVVGLLVGAFVALYQHSKPLRNTLGDLAAFFKTELLPKIKQAADAVLPALQNAFHQVSKAIKDNQGFLEVVGKLLLVFGSAAVITGIAALIIAIQLIAAAIKFLITFFHVLADVALIVIAAIIRAAGRLLVALLNSFGEIIHGAAKAFGWIPGLGGRLKSADAAFQTFTDGVTKNWQSQADAVDAFRHKLDAAVTPPKAIKVNIDDLVAINKLEQLQAFRLKDKTLTVKEKFLLQERAFGPGGGIQFPGGTNPGTFAPVVPPVTHHQGGSQGGASPRSGPLVNIENMTTTDTNDILRKSQNRLRARAGGGVILVGAG